MPRKAREDQLQDKVNSVVGFARSQLSFIMNRTMLEMLKNDHLDTRTADALRKYQDTVMDKYRAAMPMMQAEEE